ncbi:hypothetical protein NA57DRAFT_73787 [Rhizodiscina lignyota]|uniref:Uncharacterized protein n=1 Tax=Rhizodiscina lignyota TaxID=1504668 RepID=A0A9P4IIZ5_9PEZI|nr:hypothetical protein NA57DRAFT_73787 [Rhizodiscina lignyota]
MADSNRSTDVQGDSTSTNDAVNNVTKTRPRKISGALQRQTIEEPDDENDDDILATMGPTRNPASRRRIVPVHQSRISDRPPKVGEKDSSLKIKIELDLEVEVEIYARVKGDVTIGLM